MLNEILTGLAVSLPVALLSWRLSTIDEKLSELKSHPTSSNRVCGSCRHDLCDLCGDILKQGGGPPVEIDGYLLCASHFLGDDGDEDEIGHSNFQEQHAELQ